MNQKKASLFIDASNLVNKRGKTRILLKHMHILDESYSI